MTMMNATQTSFFTLAAYYDVGLLRYLYFLILLLLYVSIVGSNVLLIAVIAGNRSLHEPMYLFLLSLFANELYGSAGLFPFLLVQVLADSHTVSAPLCFLQIFVVYSYAGGEFLNLAVMSYDRCLAICSPLRYRSEMTAGKVAALIALTWLFPVVAIVVLIGLSASLPRCGNVIRKAYCGNYSIVKLACSGTRVNNIYGLAYTVASIVTPAAFIVYTYAKILAVCLRGGRRTRQKALSTCTPHVASVLNFSFGCCFQVLQSRFFQDSLPGVLDVLLSLYFLACQPLFTPALYGLKMSRIYRSCKRLLCAGR